MTVGTAGTATANGGGTGSTTAMPFACFHPGSFISPAGVVRSFVEADSDIAAIANALKDDLNPNLPLVGPGPMQGYSRAGQLFVPNRGWLKVIPGDLICVDTFGWPILISGRSAAQAGAGSLWTTSAT